MTHAYTRREILSLLGAAGAGLAAPGRPLPNILYVMADDHAAHAISAYGSRINQTPNIDRIASGGVRIDQLLLHQLHLHAEPGGDSDRTVQPQERRLHARRTARPQAQSTSPRSCRAPATRPR